MKVKKENATQKMCLVSVSPFHCALDRLKPQRLNTHCKPKHV